VRSLQVTVCHWVILKTKILVLPNTSAEGANVVAREICDGIASLKLPHARSSIGPYVTLSCGSATAIPPAQESPDTLILRALLSLWCKMYLIIHLPL